MKNHNKNIFYVLAFLQGLVFYSSIASLYRLNHGLSLAEMGVIESIFAFCMILFEIPLGMICDRNGYKKTMIICNFLFFLSKLIFWKAYGFIGFLTERILLAFVNAGLSGCDVSLLYLSIDKEESAHVFGIYQMMGTAGMVIASLSFSLFFSDNFEMAAFFTALAYLLAFFFTFFLKDIQHDEKNPSGFSVFKNFIKNKSILLLLIGSSLLVETTHTLSVFYSQLQYMRVQIPVSYYGVIFMLLQLCSLICGTSGKMTKLIQPHRLGMSLYIISALACLGLIFTQSAIVSILLLALLCICESFYYPLLNTYENESVQTASRASMLSFYAMVMNFCSMATQSLFGGAAELSLNYAYLTGAVFFISGFCLFRLWIKKQ